MPPNQFAPRQFAPRPLALRPLVLLLALALAVTACAGTPDTATGTPTETASDTPTGPAEDADPDRDVIDPGTDTLGIEVEGGVGETPQITLPGGEPPTELVVVDLVEGDGDVVPAGATVTTDYAGVSWLNDGAQFDSSFDRGQPATFPLNGVIAGWTEGIPGMRIGGRRLLVIPPDLAYGPQSPSPDIAPDDTLVFVIDLVGIE